MAVYLIDFENVRSEGLRGIENLTPEDKVWIFYSQNADSITFEAYDLIGRSNAQVNKYKIARGGKNALDFQLATFLGYCLHENQKETFYIVSKDNGFRYVLDFWKYSYENHNADINCCQTISEAIRRNSQPQALIELSEEEMAKAATDDRVMEGTDVSYVFTKTEEAFSPDELVPEDIRPALIDHTEAGIIDDNPSLSDSLENRSIIIASEDTISDQIAAVLDQLADTNIDHTDNTIKKPRTPRPRIRQTKDENKSVAAVSKQVIAESTEQKNGELTQKPVKNQDIKSKTSKKKATEVATTKTTETKTAEPVKTQKTKSTVKTAKTTTQDKTTAQAKSATQAESTAPAKTATQAESTAPAKAATKTTASAKAAAPAKTTAPKKKTEVKKENDIKKTTAKTEKTAINPSMDSAKNSNNVAEPKNIVSPEAKNSIHNKVDTMLQKNVFSEEFDKKACAHMATDFIIEATDKQDFYRRMIKAWGQKPGLEIYKVIKMEYLNLRKLVANN